jgi:hypothetical protein
VSSAGPAAAAARAAFRARIAAKGHVVDNAREAVAGLEEALRAGVIVRTPELELMLADLARVLAADPVAGEKLGGKSAEAARFILRALDRELDRA